MCLLRVTDNENDLEQSLQANDLSPELVLRWLLMLRASVNDFKHY